MTALIATSAPPTSVATAQRTDWRAITLLALGFGLVGIDRFMISTMFPVIARDLSLNYNDIGIIAGGLSIAWGVAALLMGNRADRIGRRRVLVGSMVAFSLLIGASGLATGLLWLLLVRVVMGFADGAYTPACVAATLECAEPHHHGRASGIQQMTAALFGLGFAPLAITALLHLIDWRWIFALFTLPGLVLAWLIRRHLPARIDEVPVTASGLADWRLVIRHRNVQLAMVLMLCCLTCLITTSAFLPGYMLEHSGFSFAQMGIVMSAAGIGSGIGTLVLTSASDWLGRKRVTIGACLAGAIGLALFMAAGANPIAMFGLLFLINFATSAAIALVVGPIAAEAVPPALMATASGLVIFVGEVIGGGLLPIAAGYMIERFGIERFLLLPIATMTLAALLSTMLIERPLATEPIADERGVRPRSPA